MKELLRPALLDRFEKYTLTLIFTILAYRMIADYLGTGSILGPLYVLDQLLIIVFILARRPTEAITQRPWEWFIGFAGTLLALLIAPVTSEAAIVGPGIPVLVMLTGLFLHMAAKLSLRRSFGVVAANRGVKCSGPYRLVRHPMYAGYMIVQCSLLLAGPNLQNLVVIPLCWTLFILRIAAEERLLGDDPSYREMVLRTPYRLLPGVY